MKQRTEKALLEWLETAQEVLEILSRETSGRLTYMPPQDFNALQKLPTRCRIRLEMLSHEIKRDEIIDGFAGFCNGSGDIDKNGEGEESKKTDDEVVRNVEEDGS